MSTTSATIRSDQSTTSDEPGTATPARRLPLPAVKGTMAGVSSPRREVFSPTSTLRASEAYSPAPSTHGSIAPSRLPVTEGPGSTVAAEPSSPTVTEHERAPLLVFRADPRMTTCFDGLPEGAEAVKAKFGVA